MADDKPTPRDPFELCGVTIEGKYRVASVVGDGGFGVVYRGVHKGFGELIAIKCLKLPADLTSDEERDALLERLREEGRLLHKLSRATPGIVQALDVGACETPSGKWVPFLVLEWLEGETLAHWIRKRHSEGRDPLSLPEAMELLAPVAQALAVAHAQKVAHRDVKPANLFITQVGESRTLKVLDFGIAKVLSDHTTLTAALEATALTPAAFTPRYGAPEQFNKQRGATGPWTDVFALALILVELCTGDKALDGDDPTQLYIASADPVMRPTLRARGAVVSDEVEKVVAKALAVDPRERYGEAGAFWKELEAAARELPADEQPTALAAKVGAKGVRSGVPTQRDAVGPTVPAESLPRRGRASPPEEDPMAETPAGRRALGSVPSDPAIESTRPSAAGEVPARRVGSNAGKDAASIEGGSLEPRKGGFPWLFASILVLIGGAVFAYTAFMSASSKPRTPFTTTASTAVSGAPAVRPPPVASAAPDASASASADAEPPPPPEDMVRVAAGAFEMGTAEVSVTVTRDFFIDRYEVSVRAYRECIEEGGCGSADHVAMPPDDPYQDANAFAEAWNPRCNEPRGALDHPINCVTFDNAKKYCAFRGRRLPTEAEWELAARGTDGRAFPWGTRAPRCEGACFDRNEGCLVAGQLVSTCGAGTHMGDRTPEGIFDLGGNVAEWTSDVFASSLSGGEDPKGPRNGTDRVVRGGSFVEPASMLAATTRKPLASDAAHVTIGFRCALDAPEADAGAP
jgi:eukaryotic-like serine/threonine-protein kinase